MAFTNQVVLDEARVDLNDALENGSDTNCRYKEAQLLVFLNEFVALAYSVRPDLRVGSGWGAIGELTAGQDFPLAYKYRMPAVLFIQARAEARDDEHTVTQRFSTYLSLGTLTLEKS